MLSLGLKAALRLDFRALALALRHEGKSLGLSLGLEGQKPWDLGSRLFKAHRFGYFPDDVLKVLHFLNLIYCPLY